MRKQRKSAGSRKRVAPVRKTPRPVSAPDDLASISGVRGDVPAEGGSGASEGPSEEEQEAKEQTTQRKIDELIKRIRDRRTKLPPERGSLVKHFTIANFDGYIIVGRYPSGRPGEIFVKFSKEGSTLSGLIDAFAIVTSLALQYGVPLKVICEKLAYTRYEPSGWTGESEEEGGIPHAYSITDYIARWLAKRFLGASPPAPQKPFISFNPPPPAEKEYHPKLANVSDGSPCQICGTICQRTGKCETCPSCGWNSGCG